MRIRIQEHLHVKADVWAGLQAILTGLDSAVGIATYCRLDGQGFKPRWGKDILSLSKLGLKPIQPPVQWVPGVFPQGKAARVWREPPTLPPSTTVTERVELYLYSPSEPSWSVAGQTLTLQAILLTVNEVYIWLIKLFLCICTTPLWCSEGVDGSHIINPEIRGVVHYIHTPAASH